MGLFSRRKPSTIFFSRSGETNPSGWQEYEEKTPQLHPVQGEQRFDFNFGRDILPTSPAGIPFNDGTIHTSSSFDIPASASRPSRRLQTQHRPVTATTRPATAQSIATSASHPRLTPSMKKNERPSTASRVFVVNGQPINSNGKVLPQSRKATEPGQSISTIPHDISATPLRPMSSSRSLKVRSVDLLKPNPRLSYLAPPDPPNESKLPEQRIELQFRHDGRGLFAKKTVAELADTLDTKALRKLLERDMRRYQTVGHLKDRYCLEPTRVLQGQIPQSRRTLRKEQSDAYESFGFPSERSYNPYADPGPSTIRPVLQSDRTDSLDSHGFEMAERFSALRHDKPIDSGLERPNLPPILLTGKPRPMDKALENNLPDINTSPIMLLGPNSARSTETQSTQPRSLPRESPINLLSPQSAAQSAPQPQTNVRPSFFSSPMGTYAEYEKAEEYTSEPPQNPSERYTPNSKWEDSPIIPRPSRTPNEEDAGVFTVDRHRRWHSDATTRSDAESSNAPDYPSDLSFDEEDHRTPMFNSTTWHRSSPHISTPTSRDSPVESEGSWLGGQTDVAKAVRKGFAKSAPGIRASPAVLESAPPPAVHGPLRVDVFLGAGAEGRSDYEGAEWESSDGEEDGHDRQVERVTQGSACRRVEVVHSPSVEGVIPRVVSGESRGSRESRMEFEEFEIILY